MRRLRSSVNPSRHLAALCAAVSIACTAASGQAKTQLVVDRPQLTFALYDLPNLRTAFAKTRAAALLRDPEVAEAVAFAAARNTKLGERWFDLQRRLDELAPRELNLSELGEAAAWRLGLDAFTDLRFGDATGKGGDDGMPWFYSASTSFLAARAHPDAAAKVDAEFQAIIARVKDKPPVGYRLAEEQTFSELPALVLAQDGGEQQEYQQYLVASHPFSGAIAHDGLFVGAAGQHRDFARLAPGTVVPPPSFEMTIGTNQIAPYLTMLVYGFFWGFDGPEDPFAPHRRLFGIDELTQVQWRVQPVGELLQEDLVAALPSPATGVLGALLQGMAPLPSQPLPEGTLLQIRGGFDVRALTQAIDAWLLEMEQPTLADDKLDEELRRAWTGGFALALARPKKGAFLPRVYLSLGIADRDAAERLIEKLWAAWEVDRKPRRYEEQDCTQVQVPGLPAGIQPTFTIVDDTLHLAESPASLRGLLQARAAGAPGALDVGKAPRPTGPGRALPGFEMRFDAAEIHATLQQVWLPLASLPIWEEIEPLLPLQEMPEVDTVTEHLGRGRAALRVDGNTVTLRSQGVFGGPIGQAIATSYGPLLSKSLASGWHWATENLRARLAIAQQTRIHAAIAAFEKRTGARPKSLGELAASADLADKSWLVVEGDTEPAAVEHDGAEIAKSSFRYYPEGITVTPQEEKVKVMLILVPKSSWWRIACSDKGQTVVGWGQFAAESIEDIEKAAREAK